jgi:hypothetical protein
VQLVRADRSSLQRLSAFLDEFERRTIMEERARMVRATPRRLGEKPQGSVPVRP